MEIIFLIFAIIAIIFALAATNMNFKLIEEIEAQKLLLSQWGNFVDSAAYIPVTKEQLEILEDDTTKMSIDVVAKISTPAGDSRLVLKKFLYDPQNEKSKSEAKLKAAEFAKNF